VFLKQTTEARNIMTIVEQLNKELNEMNAKRLAIKDANSVEDNRPSGSREFTYRKSPAIKAQDLNL
jgi:hypothetical protein